MDPRYRQMLIGLGCGALALALIFPQAAGNILIGLILAIVLSWPICMRSVPETYRAIIYRGGTMHRMGPPGMVFIIPLIESVGKRIAMTPHSHSFVVHQIAALDGSPVYMNLELTWRLSPDVAIIDDAVRQTFLKIDEQLQVMIEQNTSVVARLVVLSFAPEHLKRADTREHIVEIMRSAVNDLLRPHALMIDTIFWRGSVQSAEVIKERTAIAISQERIEAMIREIKLLQDQLPGMAADQLLMYQAWIDLMRRGITPPMPQGVFQAAPPPK